MATIENFDYLRHAKVFLMERNMLLASLKCT